MSAASIGQGRFLAELIQYYHEFRADYLKWAAADQSDPAMAILNYQRALLAWYEARIRREEPYTGDVYHFVQVAATHYAGKEVTAEGNWQAANLAGTAQNPLHYLPAAINLNQDQQLMIRQFQEMGSSCRELLLLSYYHRMSDQRLSEVLELGGGVQEAAARRRKCLLMVRERWQHTGLMDPIKVASPAQQVLIDHYFRNELSIADRWEVEALRGTDTLFQEAMLLREDWQDCVVIAGRQETLLALQREEETYLVVTPEPTFTPRRPLIPRIPLKGNVQNLVIAILLGVLGWLMYTTLGVSREQRLFTEYFEPFPSLIQRPVEGVELDRDLTRIMQDYDRGDYLLAYDELLPAASAYPAAPLYLGVSALALNDPRRAIDWFRQYEYNDYYRPYADWYKALAYLALDQRADALNVLVDIAGTSRHPYGPRATVLLDALE